MEHDSQHVTVSKILIHPIKSCRGTSLQHVRYTCEGLEDDRKWCIVDANTNAILTARDISKMVLIHPRIETDEMSVHRGSLHISFPGDSGCEAFSIPLQPSVDLLKSWKCLEHLSLWGHDIDGYICQSITSPSVPNAPSPSAILSRYCTRPVHLIYKGPRPRVCTPTASFPKLDATFRFQDGYPLLVLSEESVETVENKTRAHVGLQGIEQRWKTDALLVERFRPNIVLRGADPFAEDMWEEISIHSPNTSDNGGPGITLVSKCARCLLPNVDTETGLRDAAVPYKVLMKFRTGVIPQQKMKPCLGCNGVPSGDGEIRVGDLVSVRRVIGV